MSWITYKLYFSGVTRKTNPLWKKRILIISQPHWGFSGDENSFVSPGFSSRLCSASLGGWASSSATNFSLAKLRFERHPWVHKWCLKMGNHRWKGYNNILLSASSFLLSLRIKTPALLPLYTFTHPTLVSVCTHESLSNLSCVSQLSPAEVWGPSGASGAGRLSSLVLRRTDAQKPIIRLVRRRKTGNS